MSTKYDEQMETLNKNPNYIHSHWMCGKGIFAWVGECPDDNPDIMSGCLTQIRNKTLGLIDVKAIINGMVDEKLTEEITNDERIPMSIKDVTIEHLPIFLEWRLKIDALEETK